MEERNGNFMTEGKINTLEESLKQFEKPCLLEQLDESLELVRRNMKSQEEHSRLLKSVDKDLLQLSRIHHPDKAIKENKLDEDVRNSQDLQIALNATRTVLKSLTECFLKDIDVHYKYEFFAKLDINTLINDKQIDLEISNVLCKISRLSEIKRVNIIGEIRKFLLESRECLINFKDDNEENFVRHRDNGLRHLHKCIEGYNKLETECELIIDECRVDNENTKSAIQKIREESVIESQFLLNLEEVAKRSLDGDFEIFPTHKFSECYSMKTVKSKEQEYFVLPFIHYVDVLLMCSVMFDKKSKWMKLKTKIGETLEYLKKIIFYLEKPINFIERPLALREAYQLASYFNNKNHYKEEVKSILKEKDPHKSENIQEAFKESVKEIEQFLAEKFDINFYKEGKSNQEEFNERLFELKDSMSEFEEVEKNLLEKFKLYEQEANEIRKKYSELSDKIEKTEEKYEENIPNCANLTRSFSQITCNQNENVGNEMYHQNKVHENESYADFQDNYVKNKSVEITEEHERKLGDHENKFNLPVYTKNISNPMVYHLSSSIRNEYHPVTEEDVDKNNSKQNTQSIPSKLEASNDTAVTEKIRQNTQANNTNPVCIFANETTNQTAQIVYNQFQDISQEHNKTPKVNAEETSCFSRAVIKEVQEYIKTKKPDPECISGDGTANKSTQMASDQSQEIFKGCDENSKVHDHTCFRRDQLQEEPISFQMSELVSNESIRNGPEVYQNRGEYEGVKNNEATKIVLNECNDLPDNWTLISFQTAP